jgi:hypothetical protein
MRELMKVRGEPVILNDDGSVSFVAGMTIDADGGRRTYAPPDSGLKALDYLANAGSPGNWYGLVTDTQGRPVIAKSGYYVSPTTYERKEYSNRNPERYLDPETEFFAVFPGPLRRLVKPVVLGCRVIVQDLQTGATKEGVAGDTGPSTHLGEASIAFAEFFGIPSSPKNGGVGGRRFKYIFFPGIAADGYELQALG